jgi:hypothetical protein
VKQATWLIPIVVVPKINGKLRVYVDYRKLNAAIITDVFPLPFTERKAHLQYIELCLKNCREA